MNKSVCVVVGVGPGNGEAFVRQFNQAGYAVALLARRTDFIALLASNLPDAKAFPCDVSDATSVVNVFDRITREMGAPDVLIYNAGKGVWGTIEQVNTEDLDLAWRTNTMGLFLCAKQVIPSMKAREQGTIIVVGATASRRGVAGTAAFAPAKMAQRALTESMARHLGPSGVHVSLLIVDGIVGGPETRAQFASRAQDAFIAPDAIASTALHLARQDRSAWSFEIDLRPFNEKW